MSQTIIERLAGFSAATDVARLPAEVIEECKRDVLDTLGCALAGIDHPKGRIGIEAGSASATNALMNARTLAACTAAKAAGIEIYTIRLEEPDVATGTMLKECASAEDHYFDVPNRTQLDDAFAKIRNRIVKVRISS